MLFVLIAFGAASWANIEIFARASRYRAANIWKNVQVSKPLALKMPSGAQKSDVSGNQPA